MSANDKQVGGDHYRKVEGEQHWDRANRLGHDFFQYQITKYVERWRYKGGVQDLEKARHFLDKYIEVERPQQEAMRVSFTSPVQELGEHRPAPLADLYALADSYETVQACQTQFLFEGGWKDGRNVYTCRYCRGDKLYARNPVDAYIHHGDSCRVPVATPTTTR